MRPTQTIYTLVAAAVEGWLTSVVGTGAGPFTTFASQPNDGCSHPVTILSSSDQTTWTYTITGTDENGVAISEAIAGGNTTTVTTTKYFKTLTSVTLSKTLGAATIKVGWTALAKTPMIVVDHKKQSGACVSVGITGTCTYTSQQTNSDVFDSSITPVWSTLGTASSTATTIAQSLAGVTAVRTTVASHTSGVLTFVVSHEAA